MKRALTLSLALLATVASSTELASATRNTRAPLGQKTQWAPSGNFQALHRRAVFRGEIRSDSRPYARARGEVASGIGIFLSRDSIGASSYLSSPNGMGPWSYAGLNPIRRVDPDGRYDLDGLVEGLQAQTAAEEGRSDEFMEQQRVRGLAGGAGALTGLCTLGGFGPLCARGALIGLGWDGTRQGIKQLEGGQTGFNWQEWGSSGVTGAALGPLSSLPGAVPFLTVGGAGLGASSANKEWQAGNRVTAGFDAITSLVLLATSAKNSNDFIAQDALGNRVAWDSLSTSQMTATTTPFSTGLAQEFSWWSSKIPVIRQTGVGMFGGNISFGPRTTRLVNGDFIEVNEPLQMPVREGIERFPEWRVGDPITKITTKGTYPEWFNRNLPRTETIQGRYWINRSQMASAGEFSPKQLARMQFGFAPQAKATVRWRKSGLVQTEIVSKEIHHDLGNRGVPTFDDPGALREVWPWEHAGIDAQRETGYDLLGFEPL